jgi:excisionase family DNA binding protein
VFRRQAKRRERMPSEWRQDAAGCIPDVTLQARPATLSAESEPPVAKDRARDRVLTVETAAALLHVTPRTMRTWAREGRVPVRRPGRAWLFDREKLLELLTGEREAGEGSGPTATPEP